MKRMDMFFAISELLHAQPVDEVIPVLITASARALIVDANGDLDKLENNFNKFCSLVHSSMGDMMNQDLDEAREATKQ
jgi:hypothetical protein